MTWKIIPFLHSDIRHYGLSIIVPKNKPGKPKVILIYRFLIPAYSFKIFHIIKVLR